MNNYVYHQPIIGNVEEIRKKDFDIVLSSLIESDLPKDKIDSPYEGVISINNLLSNLLRTGLVSKYFSDGVDKYRLEIKGWEALKGEVEIHNLDQNFYFYARKNKGFDLSNIEGVSESKFTRHCASMVSRGKALSHDKIEGSNKVDSIYFLY